MNRSTKYKIKKCVRRISNIALKGFYIFAVMYLVWHFGRWYENNQWQEKFNNLQSNTINTYYFVNPEIVDPFVNATSELYITGKIRTGLCISTKQQSNWLEGIILRKDLDKVE